MSTTPNETAPTPDRPGRALAKPPGPLELVPEPPRQGCFVRFGLGEGRPILELHVVSARGIGIGGYSDAVEDCFILRNPDGSIEQSGSLVMLDRDGRPVTV